MMRAVIEELERMIMENEKKLRLESSGINKQMKNAKQREYWGLERELEKIGRSDKFALAMGFLEGGYNEAEYKQETELFAPFTYPISIEKFIRWRTGITDERVAKFFGEGLFTVSPRKVRVIDEMIEDDVLPKIFYRFIVLDEYEAQEKGILGVFSQPSGTEDAEVIFINYETRKVYLISNSFENFMRRGIECLKLNIVQDYFFPDEEVEHIIKDIDGTNVLPNFEYGVSVFFLDNQENWPKSWLN